MDTTILVIFILVLFSFILRYEIKLADIRRTARSIEKQLTRITAVSKQINNVQNKADYSRTNQTNRKQYLFRTIIHRIKNIAKHKSPNNTDNARHNESQNISNSHKGNLSR